MHLLAGEIDAAMPYEYPWVEPEVSNYDDKHVSMSVQIALTYDLFLNSKLFKKIIQKNNNCKYRNKKVQERSIFLILFFVFLSSRLKKTVKMVKENEKRPNRFFGHFFQLFSSSQNLFESEIPK